MSKLWGIKDLPKLNYSQNTYCRECEIIYPLGTLRCSVCIQLVATTSKSKTARKKQNVEVETE